MTDDFARDPPESRLEAGRCVMLYDPSLAGNFAAHWFDADHWQRAGALRGSAQGRGSTHFFEWQGRSYALRHYHRGGLMARLSTDRYLDRGAERSRPLQEFRITRRLQQLGLPVASVVAALYAPSAFTYQGDLVTLRIAGAVTLAALLGDSGDCGLGDPRVATPASAIDWPAIGATIARFHAVGLNHADLNVHNLLRDASGAWYLIDFDRARFRNPGLWRDDSLVRLRRSLLKICDATGVIFDEAWWHALLQGSGARDGR